MLIIACLNTTLLAKPNYPKKIDGFVFIPTGTFKTSSETSYSIHAFFAASHEVTNGEYLLFISDLIQENKLEELKIALPDTAAWDRIGGYLAPYTEYYFRHPAYADYPVVNISEKGAELYCVWLGKKLSDIYANESFLAMRLPTYHEWMYAASGGLQNAIYSWGSPYTRNADGDIQGNFAVLGDESITYSDSTYHIVAGANTFGIAGNLSDYADVTAPSISYKPNGFGLYNMSGNVSELVKDYSLGGDLAPSFIGHVAVGGSWRSPGYDVRISAKVPFVAAHPTVGFRPVFTAVLSN